jgi:hypothetical protein
MRRTYAGVGLVTLATLLLELLLTRIFSVSLSYHFAFMVISLALFGLGLSGVVLYLRPERYPEAELARLLSRHSRIFALTTVVVLLYVLNHSLSANMDVLGVNRFTWQSFFQLAFLYCFTSIPFFFGGMVVSLALFHLRKNVATLYFYDLVGASLACLLLDPLLSTLGAPSAALCAAVLAASAAVLFGRRLQRWAPEKASIYLALGLAAVLGLNLWTGFIRVGSFKEVRQERLIFSKWNAFSRIEVQRQPKPLAPALTIDSQARTDIYSLKSKQVFKKHEEIQALVHVVRKQGKVLIIGPGGGVDVMSAWLNGHRDITLAEINPIILYDVMLGKFRDYSGNLYGQPGIKANLAEGRSFVRRSKERFDVIQATLVDTWAATAAGAFALTENHLYTVEAFEDYIKHLKPDGIVTMSRWVGVWGMEFPRLGSLAREALKRLGVKQPHLHFFAASKHNLGSLLVKRTPFTMAEVHALHTWCAKKKFTILYSPRGSYKNPAAFVLGPKDPEAFYAQFPIDLRPVYDERPFFFYAVKPGQALKTLFSADRGRMILNSSGTVILAGLLVLVTLLVIAGILIPLWVGKRRALAVRTGSKLRDLSYFVCIGVGFILIEIALLHRFALHLGHPTHSLRVVLFSLLLFSGLGSLLSGRAKGPAALRKQMALAALGTVVLMGLFVWKLGPLLHEAIGWSFSARVALSVGLLAPPGLLMGMMLPTGIRLLSGRHDEIVPWAWGLNGAASVFGSVLAMVVAIHSGFTITLLAGGALYLLALVAGWRRVS